jgi:glyoxylase I family protein
MLDQAETRNQTAMLAEAPWRLHHHAYAVKDQEVNRRFIEDKLAIPLVATWCERVFRPEVGREVDYCHTFFEMGDGSALAFFQFADEEAWGKNRAILQEIGGSWHVAFKVMQATFDELMQRVTIAAVPVRKIHHGYCISMYLKTTDGLRLDSRWMQPMSTRSPPCGARIRIRNLPAGWQATGVPTTKTKRIERTYITRSLNPAACFTNRNGVSKSKFM